MTHAFVPPAPLQTAVLFLVFNRPDTTAQVFESIRKAKPPRLYIAADGPRVDRVDEADKVTKVRQIVGNVDWVCEVKMLFRKENLGCKYAVSEGISWFFEHEQEGIILEDDCLPSQSFFWYCEKLLALYKNNSDIWHISGATVNNKVEFSNSYHFSIYPGIWGWATWADRWSSYDVRLIDYNQEVLARMSKEIDISYVYWSSLLSRVKLGDIDTWDYQWIFNIWINNGLSITPNLNMVSNIGFGCDATHTKDVGSRLSCMKIVDLVEIDHPAQIKPDIKMDKYLKNNYFSRPNLFIRSMRKLFS